jgi:hypothetical protein
VTRCRWFSTWMHFFAASVLEAFLGGGREWPSDRFEPSRGP